jgi:2-keto-4-pentenoate hydratase/2-oxohepta-3-ene-1,7-dioic acid hydratase in catechol pathway
VRVFEGDDFSFANPAAIHGPEDVVHLPEGVDEIVPVLRLAAIVGADAEIGGHTLMNHWRAPGLSGQKSRDFAISLGPVVLAPPQESVNYADWAKLLTHAARNTKLLPGDVIAAGAEAMAPVGAGDLVELDLPPFGTLRNYVAAAS